MRKGEEFRDAYSHGRSIHGNSVVLFAVARPGCGRRVGFVTGKKIGGAVERNRARRCMREAYRSLRSGHPADIWLVWVARKGADMKGTRALAEEMGGLLERSLSPRAGQDL